MTGAILDLWSVVISYGSGSGIDPRIIRGGPGFIQIFFYLLGFLLWCRGMQLDAKASTKL